MVKRYLSAMVCGFGAGVLQIVPIAKSFSCCLLIPAAAILALYLDRRANYTPREAVMPISRGVIIGLATGLYAALFGSFFDLFVTFITKNNDLIAAMPQLHKMIAGLPLNEAFKQEIIDLFTLIAEEISETGFSIFYTASIIFNNLFINTLFGMLGGLIGAQIITRQAKNYTDNRE